MLGDHDLGDGNLGGGSKIETIPESVTRSASQVCRETRTQLERLGGGDEVLVRSCGATHAGGDRFGWQIGLNDHGEWRRLIATNTTEEVLFTIPLALVAYGFAGSSQDPMTFDRIRIVFDNDKVTTYEFASEQLAEVLKGQTPAEIEAGLRQLQFQMTITSGD